MIRVNMLCEDRTGHGLATVIEKAAQARRARAGKEPLGFPRKTGTIAGNTKLLKECEKYEFLRKGRFDHVFYVIDAYAIWDLKLPGTMPPPSNKPLEPYLQELTAAVRQEMTRRARGDKQTDEGWQQIASGFHPHVLVWERETLILPVSDELGLGEPPEDPLRERHAANWLKKRVRNYQKSIHGPQLLARIADSSELRERVLAATPSLAAIVEELVSLSELA